jgi:hypothetical protein
VFLGRLVLYIPVCPVELEVRFCLVYISSSVLPCGWCLEPYLSSFLDVLETCRSPSSRHLANDEAVESALITSAQPTSIKSPPLARSPSQPGQSHPWVQPATSTCTHGDLSRQKPCSSHLQPPAHGANLPPRLHRPQPHLPGRLLYSAYIQHARRKVALHIQPSVAASKPNHIIFAHIPLTTAWSTPAVCFPAGSPPAESDGRALAIYCPSHPTAVPRVRPTYPPACAISAAAVVRAARVVGLSDRVPHLCGRRKYLTAGKPG